MGKRLNFDDVAEEEEEVDEVENVEQEAVKEEVKAEDLVTKPDAELASEWGLSFAEVALKRQRLIRSRAPVPVVRLSDLPALPPPLPTGLAAVDRLLNGGGLARGEVLCLTGEHGSGKTQLCMQLCCNLVAMHSSKVLFVDTNNTFSLKRVVDMAAAGGGALDSLHLASVLKLDSFLLQLDALAHACDYDLVVVDSLAAALWSGSGGFGGKHSRGGGLLGLVAGLLRRIASRHQCALVVVGGGGVGGGTASPTWLDYLGHSKLHLRAKGDGTVVELSSPSATALLLLSNRGLHDAPPFQQPT